MTFTTATLCASFILFKGFNTTDTVNTLSLLSGFLVTFSGVYLLNLSRSDPHGRKLISGRGGPDATGTDMVSSMQTRLSLQARRGTDPRQSLGSHHSDTAGLMRAYDDEAGAEFGLTDLAEESDSENDMGRANGGANGNSKTRADAIEMHSRRSGDR